MTRPTQRQLAALVESGMILASDLQLDSLLQRVADLACEIVGARYAAVGVLDDDGNLARFVYSGIDSDAAARIGHLPTGRGVLGVVIEEGAPLRLADISQHPRAVGFPAHHPQMRSFLGVPITIKGRTFGRLYMTEKQDAPGFSKDDERMACTLAAQAGLAIENARLIEEARRRGEELARRVEELGSVYQTGSLLTSAGSLDETLAAVVEAARRITGTRFATLMLLDHPTGELELRIASGKGGENASLIGKRFAPGTSKAHAVLARHCGEVVADIAADPEIHRDVVRLLGRPRSGIFVPLFVGGRDIGALACYDPEDGRPPTETDLLPLQVLGAMAAVAVENDRLNRALRDMTLLEERERIARDLHDGVIQSIYAIGLSLQGALVKLGDREPELKRVIERAISGLDHVVRDVRNYIFSLEPMVASGRDLRQALLELAREHEADTLAHVVISVSPDVSRITSHRSVHVLHVVREILSNTARHGHAQMVSIDVCIQGDELVLTIEDDGVGFDPDAVEPGHGLYNIRRRALELRGTLDISSRPQGGMAHVLRVPLTSQREVGRV